VKEASANADGMPVYPVANLDEALAVLKRLGGAEPVVPDGDATAAAAPSTTAPSTTASVSTASSTTRTPATTPTT
jgi:hypothetical protein